MPVMSVSAVDGFIESASRGSSSNPVKTEGGGASPHRKPPKPLPFNSYISPSLYATPLQTRTSTSPPSSFAPSPYVIDHKWRGLQPRPKNELNSLQNLHMQSDSDKNGPDKENCLVQNRGPATANGDVRKDLGKVCAGGHSWNSVTERSFGNKGELDNSVWKSGAEGPSDGVVESQGEQNEFEGIEEGCSSKNIPGGSETEDRFLKSPQLQGTRAASAKEFYDALDDLYGEDDTLKTPSCISPRAKDDFDALVARVQMETERRVQAENALALWQTQWCKIVQKCSLAGLCLPSMGTGFDGRAEMLNDADPMDQFSGQLAVARLVAGAIARGTARAEIEEEMDTSIDNKNREIGRLRDKLQYYELVNHEMSQRNQETIGFARQRRKRQQRQKKWVWRSVALVATFGVTAIVYSYFPWNRMKDWKPLSRAPAYNKRSGPDSGGD